MAQECCSDRPTFRARGELVDASGDDGPAGASASVIVARSVSRGLPCDRTLGVLLGVVRSDKRCVDAGLEADLIVDDAPELKGASVPSFSFAGHSADRVGSRRVTLKEGRTKDSKVEYTGLTTVDVNPCPSPSAMSDLAKPKQDIRRSLNAVV